VRWDGTRGWKVVDVELVRKLDAEDIEDGMEGEV